MESERLGALNLLRLDVGGNRNPDVADGAPVVARYSYVQNITRYPANCGEIRKHFWALIPMFRPYSALLPSSHWIWLHWDKAQCYASARYFWILHYKRLTGGRFRTSVTDTNESMVAAARADADRH